MQPDAPENVGSSDDNTQSSRLRTFFVVVARLTLAYVIVVTVGPISWRPDFGHMNIERFVGFAVLTLLFSVGYPRRQALIAALLGSGAICLEALQFVAPGRDANFFNLIVKLGGAG